MSDFDKVFNELKLISKEDLNPEQLKVYNYFNNRPDSKLDFMVMNP